MLWTILLSSCALNNTSNRTVLTVLWTILLSSQYNNYCLPSLYSSSMVLKYINIWYSYHQGTRTLFPPPLSYVIFTKDRPTILVQSVIFSISLFTYLYLVLFFSPRSFKIWTFLTKKYTYRIKNHIMVWTQDRCHWMQSLPFSYYILYLPTESLLWIMDNNHSTFCIPNWPSVYIWGKIWWIRAVLCNLLYKLGL